MSLRVRIPCILRRWSKACCYDNVSTARVAKNVSRDRYDYDINMSTLAIRPIMSDSNRSRSKPETLVTCCWNCRTQVRTPITNFPASCHCCGCLQKYSSEQLPDYFTLLGQEQQNFNVNLPSLSLNMKKLQRQLHPDLFGGKNKEEQELSQHLSSLVNTAIVTLQNPIERALYLLSLRGVNVDLEKQQTLDSEFLSEVMELNEEVESLSTAEQWKKFRTKNNEALRQLESELGEAFQIDDLDSAQRILSRMKYYENLGIKLKELQSKFNIVD